MALVAVVIIGSFLLAFKAVLIEGSEVTILSLATVKRIGKNNVLLGVTLGGFGSILTFVIVRQFFLLLSDIAINLVAGLVIFFFSFPFFRRCSTHLFFRQTYLSNIVIVVH